MALLVAAVADDDTGATDLAGMLAAHGLRVMLYLDALPPDAQSAAAGLDAVIVGVASRAAVPKVAYARTHATFTALRELRPRLFALKYCSTFDSTAEGNIGPSIDAAMDALGTGFTVALPALPALGRTTYMGNHFVGEQSLADSPMRLHPLTPMTDANLVRHLSRQTRTRIGLCTQPVVARGAQAVRDRLAELDGAGVAVAVLDCTSNEDLETLCEACAELPLITGSSAWAMAMPRVWSRKGHRLSGDTNALEIEREPLTTEETQRLRGRGVLVVSGSCSAATARQNAWAVQQGYAVRIVDAPLNESDAEDVAQLLNSGATVLLRSPERAASTLSQTDANAAGERLSHALATSTAAVLRQSDPAALIVAGGETSSRLMRELGLRSLRIEREVEPGVPLCTSPVRPGMLVVLKSGNFGSDAFYGKAIAAVGRRFDGDAHEESAR